MTDNDMNHDSQEDMLDLNSATVEELRQLPGIGETLAARIVEYREEVQPFAEPAAITAVPGITESTYERIAERLYTGPAAPTEGPGPSLDEVPEPEPTEEVPEILPAVEPEPMVVEGESEEVGAKESFAEPLPEPDFEETGLEEPGAMEPEADAELFDGEFEDAADALPALYPDTEPAEVEGIAASELEPEVVEFEGEPSDAEIAALPIAEPDFEPLEEEEAPVPQPPPEPPLVAVQPVREGHWGRLFAFALLGALGGALLALLALYAINGTVNYRTNTERAIRAEAFRIDGDIDTISGDVDQLRARLDAMEDLSQRLGDAEAQVRYLTDELTRLEIALEQQSELLATLEQALSAQSEELDETQESLAGLSEDVSELGETAVALLAQVGALEESVSTLTAEVDVLREAAQRFDAFLTGLRELLNEASSGLPETGPFSARTPIPTAQPERTVIPLATPAP